MSFLKAEWRKLIMANYIVEPKLLIPYVPPGTELDFWHNRCYLSLVGFMFQNTRIKGLKIPFHVNFEEVNLRFYVKRLDNGTWKRGVVFIKEIVPRAAITVVANTVYKENYETMPMGHSWHKDDRSVNIIYEWECNGQWQTFGVNAFPEPIELVQGSEEEFITEHYWGYAKHDSNHTNEYEVTHPKWHTYKVDRYKIEVNFGAVYGDTFEFLSGQKPVSVMLAEGSEITVESKKRISTSSE